MSPRHRNATLGLMVALSLSLYLIYRVIEASVPAPTTVQLVNASPAELRVDELRLKDQVVLSGPLRLPASGPATAGPPAEARSRSVELAAGLPLVLTVRLQGQATPLACELEPRPQGRCLIRARLTEASALQCSYDCGAGTPAP